MVNIYALARFFPYWAIPLAVIIGELGLFFRRKKSPLQLPCWFFSAALVVLSLSWLIFRGDLHSDQWVRLWFD